MPSIEEAWALPIPAELTSRQGSGTPHNVQKSPMMSQSGGTSPSPGQQAFGGQGPMLDDKKKKMQPRKRVSEITSQVLVLQQKKTKKNYLVKFIAKDTFLTNI